MKHCDIWHALDVLAAENGMSTSGLARSAGLDPTTFNLSKRRKPDGKIRWPSTESLAKALEATDTSLQVFSRLVAGERTLPTGSSRTKCIPLIGMAQVRANGFFDDAGFPVGGGWKDVSVPEARDASAYALEICGESMEPVFRKGDVVVASPFAPVRRGDRVIVRTSRGETMAKQLAQQSAKVIELQSLNTLYPNYTFDPSEIIWMHRIIWVTQ